MTRVGLLSLVLALPCALGAQEEVERAGATILRGLDKTSGKTVDFEVPNGATAAFARLEVTVRECRFPAGNPSGGAYAFLTIREAAKSDLLFEGWMIASSPALNALDHPRYDVWVMRCNT